MAPVLASGKEVIPSDGCIADGKTVCKLGEVTCELKSDPLPPLALRGNVRSDAASTTASIFRRRLSLSSSTRRSCLSVPTQSCQARTSPSNRDRLRPLTMSAIVAWIEACLRAKRPSRTSRRKRSRTKRRRPKRRRPTAFLTFRAFAARRAATGAQSTREHASSCMLRDRSRCFITLHSTASARAVAETDMSDE